MSLLVRRFFGFHDVGSMNMFGSFALALGRAHRSKLVSILSLALLCAAGSGGQRLMAQEAAPAAPYTEQSADRLQDLVAPISLYPDSLVAQVLAASTFPEQVVEADRWVQAHPHLTGTALAQAVDPQPWDPSVKALAAFPAVLGNMDKNLSWTSSLGDAYYNQQQAVMDAVQVMRHRAQAAGTLKSTPQATVSNQDATVSIEPASPDMVYVPAYDPWTVYGAPVDAWPGWYPYPGIWFNGPSLSFGIGFGVGLFGGYAWGFPHWGFDWHNRMAMYNHGRYYSRSRTFYNRSNFYRGSGGGWMRGNNGGRGGEGNRSGGARPFEGNGRAARGYAEPRGQSGIRSGAFSGYQHGGQARDFASRGGASMSRQAPSMGGQAPSMGHGGGGGASRGGGGASRGGGGGGGGGHRR
jgi:hypothetical protein